MGIRWSLSLGGWRVSAGLAVYRVCVCVTFPARLRCGLDADGSRAGSLIGKRSGFRVTDGSQDCVNLEPKHARYANIVEDPRAARDSDYSDILTCTEMCT